MKKKIGVLLSASALAFSAAAFGLVGAKVAEPAKAATTDTVQVSGILKGVEHWDTALATLTYNTSTTRFEGSVFLYKNDEFKLVDTTANKWAGYHTDLGTTIVKGKSGEIGNNIVALATGTYTISVADFATYGDASYIFQAATGSISFAAATEHTVTEYGVYDGTKNDTAIGTETAYEGQAFTPTDVLKTGYSLDGWYTDAACTTAYVSTALSADTTLYAKYTSLTDKKYVYFSAPSGWAACYAYTFGGKQGLGAFPGTQMTMATDGVTYQGSGIYKVLFYGDSNDTQILFNKGTAGTVGTDQTADLTLTANTFYKLADASTGDADRGLAAAVVYDINAARRAVVASDPILVGSVCGISKATATSLVSEYDGLNSTAKGYVDAATDYVYNYADTTKKVNVAISDIVAQLRKIASAGSGAAVVKGTDPNQAPIIIMVVSLGIVAVATAGLWLSRRKEQR